MFKWNVRKFPACCGTWTLLKSLHQVPGRHKDSASLLVLCEMIYSYKSAASSRTTNTSKLSGAFRTSRRSALAGDSWFQVERFRFGVCWTIPLPCVRQIINWLNENSYSNGKWARRVSLLDQYPFADLFNLCKDSFSSDLPTEEARIEAVRATRSAFEALRKLDLWQKNLVLINFDPL